MRKNDTLFFRQISDSVPALVAVYDIKTGEYLYVNKAVKKLLGYNPSDFIKGGFPFVVSLVHPDDYLRILAENNKALLKANSISHKSDKDPIIEFEYRMRHKNGSYRWLHTDGSVFSRDMEGKVEVVLNASLDITKRKETEQISEKRYRTLIEQSPLSTQILSPSGKTLMVNRAWEKLWGAKLEHLKDYNMLKDKQLIDLGVMPYIKKGFRGEPSYIPAVKYFPNKTVPNATNVFYRWVSAIIYPVIDDKGKIKEVVLIHQDITREKDSIEKVKQSEQQLQAIIDESPAVIFLKDLNSRYILVNRKYEQLFNVTTQEIKGKTDYDFFPKDTAQQVTSHDKKVLEAGKPLEFEEIVPLNDEPHIYISVKFPLFDALGSPYAVCGIATDITERKQFEQRKDDFIALASHELKTPVTSLKMFAQILQHRFYKLGDKNSAKHLKSMDKQLTKLTDLVNELLEVSMVQAGKIKYKKETLSISKIINETIETIERLSLKHELILKDGAKSKVYADRYRIGQVLTNLINNAVKFSPKADKVIITSKKVNKNVVVSVQDFGLGISASEHRKIFERFYQTSDDGQTFPGLGMGLFISMDIIRRHNGKIWLVSNKGKGSTFYFSLPVVQ